jgi:hypothetical protein
MSLLAEIPLTITNKPPLRLSILHVDCARSGKQMVKVHAKRIVTAMTSVFLVVRTKSQGKARHLLTFTFPNPNRIFAAPTASYTAQPNPAT